MKARENELLHILVKQHPLPATRDAIQRALWSNSYATDSTINQAVRTLRDDLVDTDRTLIRTIPKTGYILGASPKFVCYQVKVTDNNHSSQLQYLPYYVFWFIFSLFFLVEGYQIGSPSVAGITLSDGYTHYLFDPDNIEQARFAPTRPNQETFLNRTESGYRICVLNDGVMLCKNAM
ncbi:TPA: transcriptional regulator [Vibrio parahaemolyticus]